MLSGEKLIEMKRKLILQPSLTDSLIKEAFLNDLEFYGYTNMEVKVNKGKALIQRDRGYGRFDQFASIYKERSDRIIKEAWIFDLTLIMQFFLSSFEEYQMIRNRPSLIDVKLEALSSYPERSFRLREEIFRETLRLRLEGIVVYFTEDELYYTRDYLIMTYEDGEYLRFFNNQREVMPEFINEKTFYIRELISFFQDPGLLFHDKEVQKYLSPIFEDTGLYSVLQKEILDYLD